MYIACLLGFACTISGIATAIDGDTIRVNKHPVRLQGIDAPEMSENYGPAARDTMGQILRQGRVTCKSDGTWSFDRVVATCFIGEIDIAIALVAGGWALDCAKFSGGRYRQYELPGIRGHHIRQKAYCK
jgi:micrococcal nuclease